MKFTNLTTMFMLALVAHTAQAADRPISYKYSTGTDNATHCYPYYTDDNSWLNGEVTPEGACASQKYPVYYKWAKNTVSHAIQCYPYNSGNDTWLSGEPVPTTGCDGQAKPISYQWSKGVSDGILHCYPFFTDGSWLNGKPNSLTACDSQPRPETYQWRKGQTDDATHCYAFYKDGSWMFGESVPESACLTGTLSKSDALKLEAPKPSTDGDAGVKSVTNTADDKTPATDAEATTAAARAVAK